MSQEQAANVAGLLSWIESGRPVEVSRIIHRTIYSWASEDFFMRMKDDRTARRKLVKALLLSAALIKVDMPVYLTADHTDRETVILYCDAAGVEAKDACIAAILFGSGEPRVIQVPISKILEKLTPSMLKKLDGMDKVTRITVLEMLAVIVAIRTWSELLRNKYVRIFVDNTEELFALIKPGTAAAPLTANLSLLVRLFLMRLNAVPYILYIASDRNVSDLWTRPAKAGHLMDEINEEVTLETMVNLSGLIVILGATIESIVQEIKATALDWNKFHEFVTDR
jgi:hypothetical protein